MKKITNFIIDKGDLPKTALNRGFTVNGEVNAEFMLQVFDGSDPVKFYNFKSRSFTEGFISAKNLKVKMKSNTYRGNINFPTSASGDTYTILLLTPPDKDTELSFVSGKNSYSTTIDQVVDTRITFTPITTSTSSYESMPTSVTADASPTSTDNITINIDWDVENKDNDANGFGLRLTNDSPLGTSWYFQTTEVIASNPHGDGVASGKVLVDDLTDLATGMELIYHKGTTAPSTTTYIVDIDVESKLLYFSSEQAFEDTETMTFRAQGSEVINDAIGVSLDLNTWNSGVVSATSELLTKTVRGVVTDSQTVTLNGTRGISGGNFVTMSGVSVDNSDDERAVTTNRTSSGDATASEAAGEIIVQSAQTFKGGETLTFTGSTKKVTISNYIVINSSPSINREIFLNLDSFITPGVNTA